MTKHCWMLALMLLPGCAQYQPLYQPQPSAQTAAHHRIMLTHVQDESVSELGRLLSEVLSNQYGPHDSPSHLLEANLKDVTIVTSPVQPGTVVASRVQCESTPGSFTQRYRHDTALPNDSTRGGRFPLGRSGISRPSPRN